MTMTAMKMMAVSALAVPIAVALAGSPASSVREDEALGRVIEIDAVHRNVVLQQKQGGSVGAARAGNLFDSYRLEEGLPVDPLKIGDEVVFTESFIGDTWTITDIRKR